MSIFSKIRSAKKAANEHKSKVQETTDVPDKPEPYRHTPTHAAIDALSGAPSSWKAEDRTQIKAQHKRRSAMIRNNSSLSTVGTMHRSGSYTGSSWNDRGDGRMKTYSYLNTPHDSGLGRSPLASHEISSIDTSEKNSTASGSSSPEVIDSRPEPAKYSDSSVFVNLHKSTNRKVGEAPMQNGPLNQPLHEKENAEAEAIVDANEPEGQKKRRRIFGRKNA